MSSITRLTTTLTLVLTLLATTSPALAEEVVLDEVAGGFSSPLFVDAPAGDDRLFVVERAGRIKILHPDGAVTTFLDISDKVLSVDERGLLGLAFHPTYPADPRFFVNYSDNLSGDSIVAQYEVSGDPDVAEAASEVILLEVDQPFANHNGGMMAFGSDDFLYIGFGDGGSSGDPSGHAQNTDTLLGTILRIDIDAVLDDYESPPDNPFFGPIDGEDEIWAYGLRNPWRFSFDPTDGYLYIGDVGQNSWEEIDVIGPTHAGANFGWNVLEGNHCFDASSCSEPASYVAPVHEYPRSDGISVTGGYVYRGAEIPEIAGLYFYGDFGAGTIWSLVYDTGTGTAGSHKDWSTQLGPVELLSSFGTDGDGELYVVSLGGSVYRFVLGADRIWGPTRYSTATAVSESEFPGTDVVYLALGTNFPDALVAAARGDGPVVLTRQGSLPAETRTLLEDLAPVGTIYIVGGPAAISEGVASEVEAYADDVIRLAGANRIETAATFSAHFTAQGGAVFVATAEDFPDALVAGRAASELGSSVLLVRRDEIPPATDEELDRLDPDTIYIVGGEAVISSQVETALQSYAPTVIRLAGSDRYGTAEAVSQEFFAIGTRVWLATGVDFVDALVAAAGAAPSGASLLLVQDDAIPGNTTDELTRLEPPSITIVGGRAVVSRQVQADLRHFIV